MRNHRVRKSIHVLTSLALLSGALIGAVAVGVATSVESPGTAGADTAGFDVTCPGVPGLGTVQFPTTVLGSIPTVLTAGTNFTVANLEYDVTIPASVTAAIDGFYGAGSTVSSTWHTSIDPAGATAVGSSAVTVNFGPATVPASGSFVMKAAAASPTFSASGGNVSVSADPSISAFNILINSAPTFGLTCTTPSPGPVIAYSSGSSSGPFAYVANSSSNTVSVFDTTTGATVASPIKVGSAPNYVAISPDGTKAYVTNSGASSGSGCPPACLVRNGAAQHQGAQGDSVSVIATGTNKVVSTISVPAPQGIAMSPDGSTVYVTGGVSDNQLFPIDTTLGTYESPLTVGSGADSLAITPDGTKAFVVNTTDESVSPVDLTTHSVGSALHLGIGPLSGEVAITPDGSTAYVNSGGDGEPGGLLAIDVATSTPGSAVISTCSGAGRFAISPDGTKAWIACTSPFEAYNLQELDLATGASLATINVDGVSVGDTIEGIAVSPDGSTVFVTDSSTDSVVPVHVSDGAVGSAVGVGSAPSGLAITPDQGPGASIAATTSAGTTMFDASNSVPGTSPTVSYRWNFDDGSAEQVTSGPATNHQYTVDGTYYPSVTETDAAGTSTDLVFTGQTVSRNGGPGAEAVTVVTVATQACDANATCQTTVEIPATSSTPSQTVTVSTTTPDGTNQSLTVTSASGILGCPAKHFHVVGPVLEYDSTYTPTSDVQVTDFVAGATSTAGVAICFESVTPPATYLKTCSKRHPAPCISQEALVPGGLSVEISVPPGDPRFRVDGVQAAAELPSAISAKGVIGKTIKIKGTNLLGSSGQTPPTVGFTSPSGSIVSGRIVSATSTLITVLVPNGAVTGTVFVVWPDLTVETQSPVTIT